MIILRLAISQVVIAKSDRVGPVHHSFTKMNQPDLTWPGPTVTFVDDLFFGRYKIYTDMKF